MSTPFLLVERPVPAPVPVRVAPALRPPSTPATGPSSAPLPRVRPSRPRRFRLLRVSRRRTAVLFWLAVFGLPSTAAYAYWTASGTGSGGSEAVLAQALTVSAGSVSADLYPGHGGAISFSVTNPNPYPVTITSASGLSIGSITNVFGGGSCTSSDFTTAAGSISNGTVAANATSTVTLSGALNMKTSATDGCQGVNVAVTATLNGTQS